FESDYVEHFQDYVDFLKNPSLDRSDAAVKARMETYDQEMVQAARRVHAALEAAAVEMNARNSEGHAYAESVFLGAAIAAIVVAMVVILLVMRSMTRSFNVGRRLAKDIGEGRLNVPLGKHGNDEIGQFLQAMEAMRGDLAAMEKQNLKALASRIAISALLETSLEPFSMDEQLQVALRIILNMPGLRVMNKGAIFLTDAEAGVLRLVVSQGLPEDLGKTCGQVEPGRCLCGKVLETGKILVASRGDERHTVTSPGMAPHGHCCFPIVSRGKVLGIVSLYPTDDHVMEQDEEALLTTIGLTLAGIIERRRLEAQCRQVAS
ncbi:MAG: GAF domain-containing protein, partial [Magnetococcales bacterium]|nr:GAF domain-containing protein [Magnetococcales bacterium]